MSVFTANSWLSNAKRRAKEGLMQAMGQHISTEDQEFDTKLRNFNAHVTELQKLKQAMEVWLESFEVFCTSTQILSESWKTFHNRSPYKTTVLTERISPYQDVALEVDKVMTDIHLHLQPAIHDIFKNRCLKPITFILSLVPGVHEQIQQRKLLLLDFDSYKSKIQKEHAAGRDSSHPNVARKAVKLDESAKKLHTLQTTLSKTLDEFEIARPLTLGPELAAYVACLHSFSSSMYNSTSSLLPVIPQAVSTLAILDSQVTASKVYTDKLTSMRAANPSQKLSISSAKRIMSTVESISVRPMVMGGVVGGYGESLQLADSSLRDMQHGSFPQVVPIAISATAVNGGETIQSPVTPTELHHDHYESSEAAGEESHESLESSSSLSLNGTSCRLGCISVPPAEVPSSTGVEDVSKQASVPPPKPPRRKAGQDIGTDQTDGNVAHGDLTNSQFSIAEVNSLNVADH